MALPFFTIGHSTRSLAEFAGMLTAAGVKHLVDVRTVPRSRTNPQFDRSVLPESLAAYGVSYTHAADLGGLRGKSKETPPEVNGLWTNDSFHHYADYALTPAFNDGLAKLVEVGHRQATAIMCAEAVWCAATGASSPIICWRGVKRFFTSWAKGRPRWQN